MSDKYEMDYNERDDIEIPSIEELEDELARERKHRAHSKVLRIVIGIIFAVIAAEEFEELIRSGANNVALY